MLKIWLPLNKDERNCGLATGEAVASGITFTDGGPVGKYADFSGSGNKYVRIPIDGLTGLTTACSVSTWVKIDSWNAAWQTIFAFLKTSSPWTGNVFTFIRNNTASALTFSISNGSTSIQTALCTNTLDLNRWYHFVCTYKPGEMNIYQDGVLSKTYSPAIEPAFSQITHAALGVECGTGFGSVSYQHRGGISDFRVYDHVLEPWEIKDLSNQKVFEMFGGLHVEGATNISNQGNCGGWNNSGTANRENNITTIPNTPCKAANTVRITETTDGQCAITFGTSTQQVPSKTITASVYLYITGNTTSVIQPYIRGSAKDNNLGNLEYEGNATFSTWPKDKWIRLTKTITTSSAETTVYFCAYTAKSGCSLAFNGWQIEERDHASPYALGSRDAWSTDMSCYKMDSEPYNIIKSGTSAYFNGTDSAIKIPIAETITGGTWTINLWFYRPNGEWGTKGWETLIGGPSGFELSSKNGGTNTPQIRTYSWTNSGYTYEYDRWNMVTLTRTSSGAKCYLNGELKHNGTAGAVPNNNYFIGAWNTATQQNFKGYIRSLSVYKKALTQEDITNLYTHGQ